jgi:hypothetical protein
MNRVIAAMLLGAVMACGPRQVEVRSAPSSAQNEPAIHFTNNLGQAVNVYVTSGGTDVFLQQVNGNTTAHLPVRGVASGASVQLKAVTVDGTRTYQPPNRTVVLTGMYNWTIP